MIQVSAVICTYNRENYLPKAIESLRDQSLRRDEYEILIIDNRSTDHTEDVVRQYQSISNLKYVRENRLGLSFARNRALDIAQGEIIAYLDDDAVADKNWLREINLSFKKKQEKIVCVGGKITPIWESIKPEWINSQMLGQLSMLDLGDKPKLISRNEGLVGANIAFLKDVLIKINGFSINLDRKGKNLASMGDVDAINRIRKLGYKCLYNPSVIVEHCVPKERLTQKWFIKRAIGQGESDAQIYINENSPSKIKCISISFRTLGGIVRNFSDLYALICFTQNPSLFIKKCSVYARLGHISRLLKVRNGK